jgi:uncharacterized protein (DUF305 family)
MVVLLGLAAMALSGPSRATGAPQVPAPTPVTVPSPHPALAPLARLAGRDLDAAAARELVPRFEEDIEIAYAATLNADHPPLLQWNQRMIERKSGQVKQLLALLSAAGASPGRRGVDVVTADVRQMRQLRGAPLERRYLALMIARFELNAAIADLVLQKGAGADLKTLARTIATVERREIAMLRAWRKEWYGQ